MLLAWTKETIYNDGRPVNPACRHYDNTFAPLYGKHVQIYSYRPLLRTSTSRGVRKRQAPRRSAFLVRPAK